MLREKLKKLPIPVTIVIGLALEALFIFLLHFAGFIEDKAMPGMASHFYFLQALGELLPFAVFVGITALFGYTFIFKQRLHKLPMSFYYGAVLVGYCFAMIGPGIIRVALVRGKEVASVFDIFFYVISVILVGIVEELVFRGVVFNLLLDRFPKTAGGIRAAIIVSGLSFGLIHITNVFSGASLVGAMIQALGAAAVGVLFSYIYVKTRNFWLVAFLHFLMDFCSLLSSGLFKDGNVVNSVDLMAQAPYLSAIYLVFLVPIILLLKKSSMEKLVIQENGGTVPVTEKEVLNMSRLSLVFGIVAIGSTFMMGYSIGFAVLSLVFYACAKQNGSQARMHKIGRILACVALGLGVCVIVGYAYFYSQVDVSELLGDFQF